MIIQSLSLRNFGCLADRQIEFGPHLNVIRGPNEAGKSTLQAALLTLLFEKVTSRAGTVRGWQSWHAPEMYTLAAQFTATGEEWKLVKDFAGKQTHLTNLSTGGTWSQPDAVQEKLAELMGTASRAVYESTAAIRQQEIAKLTQGDQIGEMLQERISGSGLNVSVPGVLEKLGNALTDLWRGWERPAPKNPGLMKVAKDEIDRWQSRWDVLRSQRQEVEAAHQRLAECREELTKLEPDIKQRGQFLEKVGQRRELEDKLGRVSREWQELHERTEQVENLKEEIKQITGELDALPTGSEEQAARLKELQGSITAAPEEIDFLQHALADLKSAQQQLADINHLLRSTQDRSKWRVGLIAGGLVIAIAGGMGAIVGSPWWWLLAGAGVLLAIVGALIRPGEVAAHLSNERQQAESNLAAAEHGVELAGRIELKQEGLRRELRSEELEELRQRCDDLALERATVQAQLGSAELAHIDLDSLEEDKLRSQLEQDEARLRQLEDDRIIAQTNIESSDYDAEEELRAQEQRNEAQKRLERLQRQAQVYELTREVLEAAYQQTLEGFTEPLEQAVQELLRPMTEGRYDLVRVDNEYLQPVVFSPQKGKEADEDGDLSTATAEQLYLAARLGLTQLLWPDEGPPLLLDDPLVNFDDQRRQATTELLRQVAQHCQILLFTCSDEFDSYADAVIELPGPSDVA